MDQWCEITFALITSIRTININLDLYLQANVRNIISQSITECLKCSIWNYTYPQVLLYQRSLARLFYMFNYISFRYSVWSRYTDFPTFTFLINVIQKYWIRWYYFLSSDYHIRNPSWNNDIIWQGYITECFSEILFLSEELGFGPVFRTSKSHMLSSFFSLTSSNFSVFFFPPFSVFYLPQTRPYLHFCR